MLIVLNFVFHKEVASAATVFDSTNAPHKAASYSWVRNSIGDLGCNPDAGHNTWLEFDYTTTSQTEIVQINASTTGSGGTLCLEWSNASGDSGYGCGLSPVGTGTTTVNFATGQHPFVFPYGTAISFSSVSSSVASDTSINVWAVVETSFTEIDNMILGCDGGNSTLSTSTYGIPAMQFVGSSIGVDYPFVVDYGLTGTSSTMTEDLGFFGNLFRDTMLWLFKPPDILLVAYENEKENLRTKIPWGWWNQVSAGFLSVSSTEAATTTALTMSIPHSGTTSTVAIFDPVAVTELIPSSVLELIRFFGAMGMWALFGAWIWTIVTGSKPNDDDSI